MNTGLLSNREAMKTASTQTETVGLLDLQAKNPTATWIDRVLRPDKYPNLWLTNERGQRETHRLAAEIDDNGNVYVFPMVRMLSDGTLKKYSNAHEAMFENIKTGNAVLWNGDIQSAVEFTKNYKTEEFKQYHMPRSGMLVR